MCDLVDGRPKQNVRNCVVDGVLTRILHFCKNQLSPIYTVAKLKVLKILTGSLPKRWTCIGPFYWTVSLRGVIAVPHVRKARGGRERISAKKIT